MIETTIKKILEEIGIEKIETHSSTLKEDLGLDSLQMVTLLIMIEDRFDIELEEADMDPYLLITVEDIIRLVEKYTTERGEEQNE